MLEEYRQYLLNIRNSLIQCGVEFPEGATEDDESYEYLFNLGLRLSDILYFYRVLAVSGSEYALKDFIFPLSKTYKDVIRSMAYAEFDEHILPDYKKLIGDEDDEFDFDDDEDYYSEEEPDEVVTEDVDEDLFTSMFGEAESDEDSAFSDETIEEKLDREFNVAEDVYPYDVVEERNSYIVSGGIPAPEIPKDSEEYEYVDKGVFLEDIQSSQEEHLNVGTLFNDVIDSSNTDDVEYSEKGIFLEDFTPVYKQERIGQDIDDADGYADEEDYSEDEYVDDLDESDSYADDKDYYEDESDSYAEDDEEYYEDESDGYAEDEEEYYEDEADGYAEDESDGYSEDYDEEEGYAESEDDEYIDESEGYSDDGDDGWDSDEFVEDGYDKDDAYADGKSKTQDISSAKDSKSASLKDRLKNDDIGVVAQDMASAAVTKIKKGMMSFLNGKNGKGN